MAFLDFHFYSEALSLTCAVHVLLPQPAGSPTGTAGLPPGQKYPTLYLLHGLSDDHTIWMRRTSIEHYAAERNLAVVMPAVARSFYQDMASGPKYWTFLSEELPALCQRCFPLSAVREDNAASKRPVIVGFAFDGFGIYDNVAMNGKTIRGMALPSVPVSDLSAELQIWALLKSYSLESIWAVEGLRVARLESHNKPKEVQQ